MFIKVCGFKPHIVLLHKARFIYYYHWTNKGSSCQRAFVLDEYYHTIYSAELLSYNTLSISMILVPVIKTNSCHMLIGITNGSDEQVILYIWIVTV